MNQLTRRNLEQFLETLDENTVQALQATGGNREDIAQASAVAEHRSDVMGSGGQDNPERVGQSLVVLRSER